jgi:hypothetical protein
MNGRNMPATGHDILTVIVWITVLGKSPIKRGVLDKSDLTDELAALRPGCPPEMQLEIDNMVKTIASW